VPAGLLRRGYFASSFLLDLKFCFSLYSIRYAVEKTERRKEMKKTLVIAVAGLLFMLASVAPSPAQVIELRFGHQNPPKGRTTEKFLNVWAKKVEEATKGRVKITMYPAESLFKAREALEATRGGITDINWTIIGYYTGRFPLSSVMALPFLNLSSGRIGGKVRSGGAVNSHIMQELYETVPEIQAEWKDVKVLMLNCTDPYLIFTAKKPVRNGNDLKGLKLRELGGPPAEMWKLLGATPVLLGMPEVYESASKGVIDGANIPWAAIATYKFYEVFKYWTNVGTTASPQMTIMNLAKWNSLPKDIQDQIMSVSGIYGAEFAGDEGWGSDVGEEILAAAQKAGHKMEKVELDKGEYEKWLEIAGKPIWNSWVKDMNAKGLNGQKVLDKTLELLKKYK
jgi:TRAP-type C4-dicarboxylate transport system substrate-binding protein